MNTYAQLSQDEAVKTLAAMAHDSRLGLLKALIKAGPEGISAGDLARSSNIAMTTASGQLLVLSNAGLVRAERHGRSMIYFADFDHMRHLLLFLLQDCCGGSDVILDPVGKACCA